MALTNAGRDLIAKMLVGTNAAGEIFNNANAFTHVGDGSTAFAQAQIDMQGTNKASAAMDATYPLIAANVLTFRSTFGTGAANFAWNEWGIKNTASLGSGTLLNRKVESLGTKTSAQSWQLTTDITVVAT